MNNFLIMSNNILFHRLFLLLPDITINVIGTMWLYLKSSRCEIENYSFSASIVKGKTSMKNITKDETLPKRTLENRQYS